MKSSTSRNVPLSDLQRAKAILKTERGVSASLLQRRLGIGYIAAARIVAELNEKRASVASRPIFDLSLNSHTLRLLLDIFAGTSSDGDIDIAKNELLSLLTPARPAGTVTILSAVGQATGPDRASLSIQRAVATDNGFAQAIQTAQKLIVVVHAVRATLMGYELKIICRELRSRVDQGCSISLGINYLQSPEDLALTVSIICSR